MPAVTINGRKLYYEEAGEGFPLVLLHPWPTDHAMWMFQVPVFSVNYRVVTPDTMGLGKSEKPKSGYSLKGFSDDVAGLLDRLGVKKAFVVGLSLGGAIAQKFCLDYPERVQGSIWVGAPKLPTDQFMFKEKNGMERPLPEVYLEALESKGYLHFWKTVWKVNMDYIFHQNFVKTELGSYIVNYLFEQRYGEFNKEPTGTIGVLNALRKVKILEELSQVNVPVAMVAGDGDPTLPYCKEHHKYLPSAEFYTIKRSGHMCTIDNAEKFNTIMAGFIRRHA